MRAAQRIEAQLRAPAAGLGGGAAKRHPDLTQVMFIMSGDLVELVPQGAHAVYTMHPLQMTTPVIMHSGIVDDRVANRFVYLPCDIERHLRIVAAPRPRILIHHP